MQLYTFKTYGWNLPERSRQGDKQPQRTRPDMNFFVIAVVAVFLVLGGPGDGTPSQRKPASEYFNLCSRKDPKFTDCVKNSIDTLKPQLITGIPELNILSIEPMVIPRVELVEGRDNFKFRQVLTNLSISGLSKFSIEDVKADMSKWFMELTMRTPFMRMTADYDMEGKILVIPIKGNGDCEMNFTDVTTIGRASGSFVQRGGKEFVEVEDFKWDISVKGAQINFNNLFNGDKTLGPATNLFLNENWKEAFQTYKGLPEEAFGVLFKDLTNRIFKQFSTDEIFLD